jgi:streptogramin lyase
MWFTQYDSNQIGRITMSGKVKEFSSGITADSAPFQIAAGPDGDMWFTQYNSSQIGRITMSGKVKEFTVTGGVPWAIAAGPDGDMWFTQQDGNEIGRITMTGKVSYFNHGITANSEPGGIAAGPDGDMWFTQYDGDDIGRITMTGTITEFDTGITAVSAPYAIAAGPDKAMWFTQYDSNQVGRITMTGLVHEFSAGITANSVPTWIAEGPDGSLWFAQQIGERVARITTGVPSPPRAVGAGPRNRAAVVTWTAPVSDGATAISGYRVTATPGGRSCATSGLLTCTVTGLKNKTNYRFAVTAHNSIGTGLASALSAAVTAGIPTAPRRLRVSFPHPGAARATWRAPAFTGSGPVRSYQIRWSANDGHSWTTWANTMLRRHASRTGLSKGTTYLVQVRGRDHSGAGLVATLTFTQTR